MEQVDCIVVGAGVIGLAVARALAQFGRDVLIIEANDRFGAETSSRNNEVVHAGFLYPADSLKARLCSRGRDSLYRYCGERSVAHRRIGKLMIATSENELSMLRALAETARNCGLDDLTWVDPVEARAREPNLCCLAALHSPSTGIVDAHGLMLALLSDAEGAGATIAYRTRVISCAAAGEGTIVETAGEDGGAMPLQCRTLINAAGLGAHALALSLHRRPAELPMIEYAKGNFFSYSGALPFRTLIMPLGETLAAGAAFTIDHGGQGKFGPDLEWATEVDYGIDPGRVKSFVAGIRRYFPDVDPERLAPNYSGIRPRVHTDGLAMADWLVLGPSEHGMPGVFHLLGFDTPGLTSCLAIADLIAARVTNKEDVCRVTES
jgi:L-2-hydroxyglutarate oxidase LhgO